MPGAILECLMKAEWWRSTLRTVLLAGGLMLPAAMAAADIGSGSFVGIHNAIGMHLDLQASEEGRIVGRLQRADGIVFSVNGQAVDDTARGSLTRDGDRAFFRLTERPLGLELLFIPRGTDGNPDMDAAVKYILVRENMKIAGQTERFVPAPREDEPVTLPEFLTNYGVWPDQAVAEAFDKLDADDQAVLRLYGYIQTDLMMRMCRAGAPVRAIEAVFSGQTTSCPGFLDEARALEDSGSLEAFGRRVKYQVDLLSLVLSCDKGEGDAAECAEARSLAESERRDWRDGTEIVAALAGAADAAADAEGETAAEVPLPPERPGSEPEVAEAVADDVPLPPDRPPETEVSAEIGDDGPAGAAVPMPRAKPALLPSGAIVPVPAANPRR